MAEPAVRAERNDAASSRNYYLWEVSGKPVAVKISLELVERIENLVVENFRSLDSRGSEIGGLLLGNVTGGNPWEVILEDYEAVPCDYSRGPLYRLAPVDVERFDHALARPRTGSGLRVVGFFRSHARKSLSLEAEEEAFFASHFPEPHQMALLVRPFATKASTGGIFLWEGGAFQGQKCAGEFAFRRSELERGGAEGVPQRMAAPIANAVPPEAAPPRPSTRAQIVPIASRREAILPKPQLPPVNLRDLSISQAALHAAEAAPAEREAPRPPESPKTTVTPVPAAPPPLAPELAPKKMQAAVESILSPVPELDPKLGSMPETVAEKTEQAEPASPARARSAKLVWIAGASAAAAVLLSGILVYPGLHRSKGNAVPGNQDTSALSLRVERSSGELLLTWNRDSESIRNAAHAVLSIADGDRHENVNMDLAQLRNGSIVYSPSSGDVVFQLAVTGKNSSQLQSESVRVLRTRPSPMPDEQEAASSKQAPAAPKQTAAEPAPVPEALPETPAPKPAAAPVRAFQMETLAQRLRPARSSDLPDAPGLTGAQSAGFALPNENLTAPAPPQPPTPAVTPTVAPGPSVPAPATQSAKLGGQVHEAVLVSKVDPEYPTAARQARVQGTVVVVATIGKDGKVTSAKAISGPALLQNMAVSSVKEWIYKPAILNGASIESETRVELKFTLGR